MPNKEKCPLVLWFFKEYGWLNKSPIRCYFWNLFLIYAVPIQNRTFKELVMYLVGLSIITAFSVCVYDRFPD